MRIRAGLLAAAGLGALLVGGAAEAETLREALIRTYQSNPVLTAERAQLRGTDEGIAIARAAGRPRLSGTGGLNQDVYNTAGARGRDLSLGATVSLPLFTGGRVRNSVRAADIRIEAGRADLRAVEGDIFTEAVGAYMDVIRDRSIVALNRNQVRVLETNLQASRDRFEVGDLTRTDVAQSEARLALARSNLVAVQGQLTASEENYRRITGAFPDELQPPPPLPPLPGSPDDAADVALTDNPALESIAAQARAAALDVDVVRADRLPTLSAISSGNYTNFLGSADEQFGAPAGTIDQSQTNAGVGIAATIPIYQGGLVGARVRQAQAFQSQLLEQNVAVERSVLAEARAAFSSYQAALGAIQSNDIAVAANSLALEGTRAEQSVGTRNLLDVLNAEQELLNSQVLAVTARRDAYVAGFALLNAMGRAEADDLGLDGGPLYDPVANYDRVSRTANDWANDPTPEPVATRTVGTPDVRPPSSTVPVLPSTVQPTGTAPTAAPVSSAPVSRPPGTITP